MIRLTTEQLAIGLRFGDSDTQALCREAMEQRDRLSTLRTWAAARIAACDAALTPASTDRLTASEVGGYLQERRVVEAVMRMVGEE